MKWLEQSSYFLHHDGGYMRYHLNKITKILQVFLIADILFYLVLYEIFLFSSPRCAVGCTGFVRTRLNKIQRNHRMIDERA